MPKKPRFTGYSSAASSMRARFHAPGVQVVASVPVAGPVPPPSRVVTPLVSAVVTSCGQMKWMWLSMAPAVQIIPSPASASVPGPITKAGSTPSCSPGLPALPMPQISPSRTPRSAL